MSDTIARGLSKNNSDKIGHLLDLQTTEKTDLVGAINETTSQLAEKATQTALNDTNANVTANTNAIGSLSQLNTIDKTSVVNALKEIKTQANSNTTAVSNIGNASPKGIYATLSALQTAFPTGTTGVYIVTADGKWYYYNGSAWTAGGVYQSTGISDGEVKLNNISGVVSFPSKNLFNKLGALSESPTGSYASTTYDAVNDLVVTLGISGVQYGKGQKINLTRNTLYTISAKAIGKNQTFVLRNASGVEVAVSTYPIIAGNTEIVTFNSGNNDYLYFLPSTLSTGGIYGLQNIQIEQGNSASAYTPYKLALTEIMGAEVADATARANITVQQSTNTDIYAKMGFVTNPVINMFVEGLTTPSDLNITNGVIRTGFEASAKTSDFMPVVEGNIYTHNVTWAICFYNSAKEFISGYNNVQNTPVISIPYGSGIAFVRLSDDIAHNTQFSQGSSISNDELKIKTTKYAEDVLRQLIELDYFPTLVNNCLKKIPTNITRWEGKEINIMGDSITAGLGLVPTSDNYTKTVKSILNPRILNNYGQSATCIAVNDYADPNPFVSRYSSISNTADLNIIFGGINDYRRDVQIGAITDMVDNTFYGALKILISGIITNNPNSRIVMITPMQDNSGSRNINFANNKGYYQKQYVQAIKDVAEIYAVPVLDLYKMSGLNAITAPSLTQDGLHPTALGAVKFGTQIANFLKTI